MGWLIFAGALACAVATGAMVAAVGGFDPVFVAAGAAVALLGAAGLVAARVWRLDEFRGDDGKRSDEVAAPTRPAAGGDVTPFAKRGPQARL